MRHEVIGHCCVGEALLHCDQQDCEWCDEDCPLARAMKTSHPAEAVGFLFHKAGYEIPVRARAVPVRNERGTIIGAVEIFEEQQQATILDQREKSLNFPGCMDELTSVASRAMMKSHLRETLGTFAEVQVPFGVLLFRLEGLERFRTSSGPDAAAALLRMVARTIEGALLRTDFIGRWGDDQFLAILNGCRDEALQAVRERVRRMLASLMQGNGIRTDQITQVRGFADQRLRKPDAPLDPANRRISVIVQYIMKNTDDDERPSGGAGTGRESGGSPAQETNLQKD